MSSIFIRPDTGVWFIQWFEGKRRRRASLKTKDKHIAKKMQREFDGEQEQVRSGMADPRVSLDDAFEKWLKSKTIGTAGQTRYRQSWWRLTKFFDKAGVVRLGKITTEHIATYLNERLSGGSAPKTAAEEIMVLKAVLKWALEQGIIRKMPAPWPKIKTPVHSPATVGAYTQADVRRILDHFHGHPAGPVLNFLAWTGCRRGEAEALVVADVDLAGGSVTLQSTKTMTMGRNQFRRVELHPDLRPILEKAIAGKAPSDPVFTETRKHRPAWLTQLLETACRQLGIQYRRVHGLRHTWITRMLMAGCPVAVVMQMAGHSNLATTQRYLTANEQTGWVGRL